MKAEGANVAGRRRLVLAVLLLSLVTPVQARLIRFSGYDWLVKDGAQMGPGPNDWSADNVFVDAQGHLHLRLRERDGRWTSAEVATVQRLGFGRYQFVVDGQIDRLDPNVVLGLFSYPPPDVGANGTNEIDIEFARFGDPGSPPGTYSISPAVPNIEALSRNFPVRLHGSVSSHSFTWRPTSVLFLSRQGANLSEGRCDEPDLIAAGLYHPRNPQKLLPQQPMPVHINLWSYRGQPPRDGRAVEIIIRGFHFQPLADRDNHNPFHRISSLCALRLLTESRVPHAQYFGLITP